MDRLQHASPLDHVHLLAETCPLCDQVIPNDRLASVQARHAEHERDMQARVAKAAKDEQDRLKSQFEADKAQTVAKLQADFGAREEAAREAARKATLAQVEEKMADSAKAVAAAEDAAREFQKKLDASAVEAAAKVTSAREEATREARAALQPQLVAAAEAVKATAAEKTELVRKLEASATDTAAKVSVAREEAARLAQAALQPQLDAERAAALAAKSTTEAQLATLQEQQNKLIADATQEARSALEKAHQQTLDLAASKHFEENQKLRAHVADLGRQLDTKNANELGEGAEVDLFEALKDAYPDDDIVRIGKGAPGADIRHTVMRSAQACGVILYDSKNHKDWRNHFTTKLRADQLADKADHAVLSSGAFPKGASQLHLQDGVVVANPARVVMVGALLRAHIIHSHTLRLSIEDREGKALELYDLITSDTFSGQLAKIHSSVGALLELETNEKAADNRMWTKRGALISAVGKAEADLRVAVGAVIGTEEGLDAAITEAHKADGETATAG